MADRIEALRHAAGIKRLTVGGVLTFRIVRCCNGGTHVAWVPSSAAHLVEVAYARDGQMAGVVLQPSGPRAAFRLIGTRKDRSWRQPR